MSNSSRRIKIGAMISYLSIGVNILAGLLYTPWMVSQIGTSDYGLYTLANSLISLFLLDFGLSAATSRFLSKYRAEGSEEKAADFLGMIYKLYLLIDAILFVVLIVVYFMSGEIYKNLTPHELERFKVVYAIAGIYSLINFPCVTLNGILTAYEQFIGLKIADLLYRIGVVAITVIALIMGYGLYALVTVNAFCGIVSIVYKYIVVRKRTGAKANFRCFDKSLLKEIFGFSIWSTVSSVVQRLIFNICPTILGAVANTAEIAVFGIVTTIEGYTYTITSAINGMFLPRISRILIEDNSADKLTDLTIRVGKFQFILNSLIYIGFALIGQEFILLWMGPDFQTAYWGIMLVLLPAMFFNSLQIVNTTMIANNMVRLQAVVSLCVGGCSLILSLIFSTWWGMLGASLAICIAYTLRAILFHIVAYRSLHIDMLRFTRKCYLRVGIPAVAAYLLGYFLISFLPSGSWLYLVVKGIVIVAVFAILVWVIGLDKTERALLWRRH